MYERRTTMKTVPNIDFCKKNGLNIHSNPLEWFDAFMTSRHK